MVKGVVDIERSIVAFGGEYHMDANVLLLNTAQNRATYGASTSIPMPQETLGLNMCL